MPGAEASAFPSLGTLGSDISGASSIYSGLQQGGLYGDLRAFSGAANIANNFGASIPGIGALSPALNIYSGLKQGGFMGDTQAALGAAGLLNQAGVANIPGVNMIAAPLSLYNAINNWQSGATGADAMGGLSAGASIGTAIMPGIGTLVGGLGGALVGAISSAFGSGEKDPEQSTFGTYQNLYNQYGGQLNGSNVPPAQAYQSLAGMFDSRQGYGNPLWAQFGRMGEGPMLQAMTQQINNGLKSGVIQKNSTPQQIYQSVVQPWIATMPGGQAWNQSVSNSSEGGNGVVQNLLTTLIGQYQNGANGSSWLGVGGGAGPQVAAYGASGFGKNPAPTAFPQLSRVAHASRI